MDDPGRGHEVEGTHKAKRGRTHDAERARKTILDAAEEVFAEHGFDGARVDAIAATAGYNKSLIFQYFGDKLNLYAEVLKRADRQGTEMQARVFGVLSEDESIALDACKFKTVIKTAMQVLFDYLNEHPRIIRILNWEQAEGWQTWTRLSSQFDTEDIAQFRRLCSRAESAGLLRSDRDPLVLLTLAEQIYMTYLSSVPLYQTFFQGGDATSSEMLARIQEYIVEFVIHGILVEPEPS
jgi:TetR/AcrR family transcriptional regulator